MQWISVKDKPLYTVDSLGWVCTEEGEQQFIAYVPTNVGAWVKHCVVEDEIGLCVVGEDDNWKAGYELEDVTHYILIPEPPKENQNT